MNGSAENLAVDPAAATIVRPQLQPSTTKDAAREAARTARYTGASIASDHIAIATVEGGASHGFKLCLAKSCQIELEDRDQDAARGFLDDVRGFFQDSGIQHVLLRELATTGPHRTKLGLKLEALLQLVPGVRVEFVHSNTIIAWKRHSRDLAPLPVEGLAIWETEMHNWAIAAACIGEMRVNSVNRQEASEVVQGGG